MAGSEPHTHAETLNTLHHRGVFGPSTVPYGATPQARAQALEVSRPVRAGLTSSSAATHQQWGELPGLRDDAHSAQEEFG